MTERFRQVVHMPKLSKGQKIPETQLNIVRNRIDLMAWSMSVTTNDHQQSDLNNQPEH